MHRRFLRQKTVAARLPHAPPPLAARGLTRRRKNNNAAGDPPFFLAGGEYCFYLQQETQKGPQTVDFRFLFPLFLKSASAFISFADLPRFCLLPSSWSVLSFFNRWQVWWRWRRAGGWSCYGGRSKVGRSVVWKRGGLAVGFSGVKEAGVGRLIWLLGRHRARLLLEEDDAAVLGGAVAAGRRSWVCWIVAVVRQIGGRDGLELQ